ncbi:MAG: hypothetical protein NXI12_11665 [Alphaproteobacteria bacterium]|nr:hypothetical protein [Alphaproteobacteria bacterium]
MAIRKTPLLWTASLAAITVVGVTSCGAPQDGAAPAASQQSETAGRADASDLQGEGGEGGEGGEAGGEFGIDPARAETDPVVYLSAIEVMRAHYLAGLAALEAGDRAAAAEMFSHPVSEIYIDFEPVIEARGGTVMLDEMNHAAVLHFQGASQEEIEAAVAVVLGLLDENEQVAPSSDLSPARVDAAVLMDLGERAALQYGFVQGAAAGGEAWLDAYGFNAAAQVYAVGRMDAIAAADPTLAAGLRTLLSRLDEALGAYEGPADGAPDPQAVTSALEAARGAL